MDSPSLEVLNWAGWGSEQPGLVEGVLVHGGKLELDHT